MFKKAVLFKVILAGSLLALVQIACSVGSFPFGTPTATLSGGVVKGVVYGDLNGNGVIDPGEGPLAGAQVT